MGGEASGPAVVPADASIEIAQLVQDCDRMALRLYESYRQMHAALADRERLNSELAGVLADLETRFASEPRSWRTPSSAPRKRAV